MQYLKNYYWHGNLRELRNVLERLQCIGPSERQSLTNFEDSKVNDTPSMNFDFERPFKEAKEELIDAFERQYLEKLLAKSKGRIAPAAREAGLNRKYFYDLLRKHGLHGSEQ